MARLCVACSSDECYSITIMGKGPKGGIWYAGKGEQEQNYLTQLVLYNWEGDNIKANYFQANVYHRWFTSHNTNIQMKRRVAQFASYLRKGIITSHYWLYHMICFFLELECQMKVKTNFSSKVWRLNPGHNTLVPPDSYCGLHAEIQYNQDPGQDQKHKINSDLT